MRKIRTALKSVYLFVLSFLAVFFPSVTFAQETIQIKPPSVGLNTETKLGTIIGNMISIIMVAGAIFVLVMLVIGAFQWITSGGEKEGVSKARERIINALIGLVILSIAFVLAKVVGSVVGINLSNVTLPRLDTP